MPEMIAYGESIEGKRPQYNPGTEEFEPYTESEGRKYTFEHYIGHVEDLTTISGYLGVKYDDIEVMNNPTFKRYTPENSLWSAIWPLYLSPYESEKLF